LARRPSALVPLRNATDEASHFLESPSRTSERLSERTSEGLFGTLGGVLGSIAAYGLTLTVPAVSFAIAAPLGGGLGIILGLLAIRGTGRLRIERRIHEQSLLAGAILDQIKSLPRNTPPAIRQKLWDDFERTSGALSDRGEIKALPPPQDPQPLLLPPPEPPARLSSGPDAGPAKPQASRRPGPRKRSDQPGNPNPRNV
jgi:hypothetical protein